MASPPEGLSALPNGRASRPLATREPEPATANGRGGRGPSPLLAILVAIVVGGLLVWAFAGIVSVAFHIAELVALALVAGWVGYKLGHARGRRGH